MNENQTTIGGRTISVGWLPATEAIKVEVALVNICGEALFKALSKKGADTEEIGAAAVTALSGKMDSAVVTDVLRTLHSVTTIDGKRLTFEEAYGSGRHRDLWQVAFFVLKYNFKDFFPASLFDNFRAKLNQTSSPLSSQTSTGTSGGQ